MDMGQLARNEVVEIMKVLQAVTTAAEALTKEAEVRVCTRTSLIDWSARPMRAERSDQLRAWETWTTGRGNSTIVVRSVESRTSTNCTHSIRFTTDALGRSERLEMEEETGGVQTGDQDGCRCRDEPKAGIMGVEFEGSSGGKEAGAGRVRSIAEGNAEVCVEVGTARQ